MGSSPQVFPELELVELELVELELVELELVELELVELELVELELVELELVELELVELELVELALVELVELELVELALVELVLVELVELALVELVELALVELVELALVPPAELVISRGAAPTRTSPAYAATPIESRAGAARRRKNEGDQEHRKCPPRGQDAEHIPSITNPARQGKPRHRPPFRKEEWSTFPEGAQLVFPVRRGDRREIRVARDRLRLQGDEFGRARLRAVRAVGPRGVGNAKAVGLVNPLLGAIVRERGSSLSRPPRSPSYGGRTSASRPRGGGARDVVGLRRRGWLRGLEVEVGLLGVGFGVAGWGSG